MHQFKSHFSRETQISWSLCPLLIDCVKSETFIANNVQIMDYWLHSQQLTVNIAAEYVSK